MVSGKVMAGFCGGTPRPHYSTGRCLQSCRLGAYRLLPLLRAKNRGAATFSFSWFDGQGPGFALSGVISVHALEES